MAALGQLLDRRRALGVVALQHEREQLVAVQGDQQRDGLQQVGQRGERGQRLRNLCFPGRDASLDSLTHRPQVKDHDQVVVQVDLAEPVDQRALRPAGGEHLLEGRLVGHDNRLLVGYVGDHRQRLIELVIRFGPVGHLDQLSLGAGHDQRPDNHQQLLSVDRFGKAEDRAEGFGRAGRRCYARSCLDLGGSGYQQHQSLDPQRIEPHLLECLELGDDLLMRKQWRQDRRLGDPFGVDDHRGHEIVADKRGIERLLGLGRLGGLAGRFHRRCGGLAGRFHRWCGRRSRPGLRGLGRRFGRWLALFLRPATADKSRQKRRYQRREQNGSHHTPRRF